MNAQTTLSRPDDGGDFPHTSFPGGYSLLYLTADSGVLCCKCANGEESKQAEEDCPDDNQWRIVAQFVHWEGPPDVLR